MGVGVGVGDEAHKTAGAGKADLKGFEGHVRVGVFPRAVGSPRSTQTSRLAGHIYICGWQPSFTAHFSPACQKVRPRIYAMRGTRLVRRLDLYPEL